MRIDFIEDRHHGNSARLCWRIASREAFIAHVISESSIKPTPRRPPARRRALLRRHHRCVYTTS